MLSKLASASPERLLEELNTLGSRGDGALALNHDAPPLVPDDDHDARRRLSRWILEQARSHEVRAARFERLAGFRIMNKSRLGQQIP